MRLEGLVAAHAREVVLLRNELQMQGEHEQRQRRHARDGAREIRRRRDQPRLHGKRVSELGLEREEQLVVIEAVELEERRKHLARLDVDARALARHAPPAQNVRTTASG